MIANLKSYPAMKDSGIEWLGEVPEHWGVQRGKWLFRHKKQINADRANTNVLSLTLRGVVNNKPDNPEGLVPKDYATYQFFCKGDLVFKLIDLENLSTSRVGLVHEDGIMSSAYVRLIPHSAINIRFFFQQYFDLYQRGIYNQLGAGVRSTLGPNDLLNMRLVVPPLPEQVAIVQYLDHVDKRIRRYIRAKQKLIVLLEEQKQTKIHRAVTRGLDLDVLLKPSGVEWLGDVPEHWEVTPGRNCFFEKKKSNVGLIESTVLSLSYGNIVIKPKEKLHGLVPASFETYQIIEPGDIVCRPTDLQNDKKSLRFGLSKHHGIITSAYLCFGASSRIRSCFAFLLLHAYDLKKIIYQLGSGLRQNLSWDDFKGLPCLVPPLPEQAAIVEYLDQVTADIDNAIDRARREIELLREYLTRLIADLVTGKLDVREAAANLPDEADKPDPLNEAGDLMNEGAVMADNLDAIPEEVKT